MYGEVTDNINSGVPFILIVVYCPSNQEIVSCRVCPRTRGDVERILRRCGDYWCSRWTPGFPKRRFASINLFLLHVTCDIVCTDLKLTLLPTQRGLSMCNIICTFVLVLCKTNNVKLDTVKSRNPLINIHLFLTISLIESNCNVKNLLICLLAKALWETNSHN